MEKCCLAVVQVKEYLIKEKHTTYRFDNITFIRTNYQFMFKIVVKLPSLIIC
jgi:hypothetical protein